MLAHCNVVYQYTYEPEKFDKPQLIKSFFLKKFVKDYVVGLRPYKKSSRAATEFIVSDFRDFQQEKKLLINNLIKTMQLGESFFEGRENISFGK